VTFFAFQDVMMCTIGITLITTIILILQIGRSAAAMQASDSAHVVVEQREELARLLAAIDVLAAQISQAELALESDAEMKLARDALSVRSMGDDLSRLRNDIVSSREALERMAREARADQQALLALELMKQRDELHEQLKELNNRRRIVYLVAPGESFVPLVTEVSSSRLVVSTDQSREAPLSLPSSDPEMAAQALLGVFMSLPDREQRYLLLVLKPSGIPTYLRLRELLQANQNTRNVRIGLDLIPEDHWTTDEFPARPNPGSGATP
jgi:hypothetical protein